MRVAGDGAPRESELWAIWKAHYGRNKVPVRTRHQLMYRTQPSSGPSRIERRYADPSFGGSGAGVKSKKFRDKIVRGGPDLTERHMAQTASTGGNKVGPDPAPKTTGPKPDPAPSLRKPPSFPAPTPDPAPRTKGQLAYARKQLVYRAMARAKMGKGGAATDARLRGGQKYKLGGS